MYATCWDNCWNFAEAWFCPWSHKVTSVCNCRSSFCWLLQLRVVHSSHCRQTFYNPPFRPSSTAIWTCIALLTGITKDRMKPLQAVQDAATRLGLMAVTMSFVMPLLGGLHWLLVGQRVIFKTAVLVWMCIYLSILFTEICFYKDVTQHRSFHLSFILCILRFVYHYDNHYLSTAARAWNALPSSVWWRGSVVERRSLAGELSLSCARPATDG